MAKVTVATVNAALRKLGVPERLVNGGGYFYFWEGSAPGWTDTSVYVYRADELTLAEWLAAYEDKKAKHEASLDTPPPLRLIQE